MSQFNIDDILSKADLRQLAEKAGAHFDKGRSVCPLHGGDNPTAFTIFEKEGKELFYCYTGNCGGGDAIKFVELWQGMTFKQACAFLGGDVVSDPIAMERSAQERLERAKVEHEEARLKMEARRHELQLAQKHIAYCEGRKQWARDMWTERGLDEGMQEFFTLGSCDAFRINEEYSTPTLTIPIMDEERQLLNIKHRLIKPQKANDKYRPETSGLGAFPPLLAVPEMGYDGDLVVVVEGEIKAMVTWTRLDVTDIQVIGVPGKDAFKRLFDKLSGKKVIVIPDPKGEKEAFELARKLQGRVLEVPNKIDDFLLATNITSNNFYAMLRQARKV